MSMEDVNVVSTDNQITINIDNIIPSVTVTPDTSSSVHHNEPKTSTIDSFINENIESHIESHIEEITNVIGDTVDTCPTVSTESTRKPRGMPRGLMNNQLKYIAILEKQKKMQSPKKDKKSQPKSKEYTNVTSQHIGKRRVIVGGVVKYLPCAVPQCDQGNSCDKDKSATVNDGSKLEMNGDSMEFKLGTNSESTELKLTDISEHEKKLEMNGDSMEPKCTLKNTTNSRTKGGRHIPERYARQINKDIKTKAAKNINNFSDLRRIRAIDQIEHDPSFDAEKASIVELRKMKAEQRRRERQELNNTQGLCKRESTVQAILKNDRMSKFAKTVAIKNLSINSRHSNIRNKLDT